MNKARKKKAQKDFYSLAKRLNKRRSENSHSYKSGMKFLAGGQNTVKFP